MLSFLILFFAVKQLFLSDSSNIFILFVYLADEALTFYVIVYFLEFSLILFLSILSKRELSQFF